jgi:hypothetical protein
MTVKNDHVTVLFQQIKRRLNCKYKSKLLMLNFIIRKKMNMRLRPETKTSIHTGELSRIHAIKCTFFSKAKEKFKTIARLSNLFNSPNNVYDIIF